MYRVQDFINDIAERTTHANTMIPPTELEKQWQQDIEQTTQNMGDEEYNLFMNQSWHFTKGDISY